MSYLWRHNSILNLIINTISKNLSAGWIISSDLPIRMQGCSIIPAEILITLKEIVIMELSVPFERNIDNTYKHKVNCYHFLISDIRNSGFHIRYYAEIGSKGNVSAENSKRIKDLLHRLKCTAKL